MTRNEAHRPAIEAGGMTPDIYQDPHTGLWDWDITYDDGSIAATGGMLDTHEQAEAEASQMLRFLMREQSK